MSPTRSPSRQAKASSLQQAASTVFVLTAVLPLLVFVWILHTLDAMRALHVQLGLALSLAISLLGFTILRIIMRRTSDVLQLLVRAEPPARTPAAQRSTAAAPKPGATGPSATAPGAPGDALRSPVTPPPTASVGDAQRVAATAPTSSVPAESEPVRPPAAPLRVIRATAWVGAPDAAPAVGSIMELRDAAQAVARRWRREAEPLIGLAVLVSVVNLERPETGTLTRVTDDGMVLEQDGMEYGVLWRLVTAIEPDANPVPVAAPS